MEGLMNQNGRSMVEMLGVLVIIGVLSVGAIAGYQKAITQYRVNKYAESVDLLVSNFILNAKTVGYTIGGRDSYAQIMQKLNLIPDGMHLLNSEYIEDIFKQKIMLYHDNSTSYFNHYGIVFYFDNSPLAPLLCEVVFKTAQQNHEAIWEVYIQPKSDTGSLYKHFYGDSYCSTSSSSKPCVRNLTVADINNTCHAFLEDNDYGQMQIVFK